MIGRVEDVQVDVGYLPNIFATMKIRTAPPKPPPKRKYTSEYPAAAIMGCIIRAIIVLLY